MKISYSSREQGKVILICLFTMITVGVVLISYLGMGSSHAVMTARSQAWNIALPVAEAGLEEGLTQLNYTRGLDLTSNGWSKVTSGGKGKIGDYFMTRALSEDAYYEVYITENGKKPNVTSIGYARAPLTTNFISRTIVAGLQKTNVIFTKAMIARKHIRAGKTSLVDSFDSTDSKYSTGGQYDPAKRKATASVAASSNKKNAIKIDNSKFYGDASVLKKGGIEFKNKGTLGDTTWVDGGNLGSQSGRVAEGFTYDFPVVQEPWPAGTGTAPIAGPKYGGEENQYLLDSGNYELSANIELKKPLIVKTNATATLYLRGDFKASEDIIIHKGATLKIYMNGHKFEINDRDVKVNDGDAVQFQYYGMPKNKEIKMKKKGGVEFHGVVYAPNAKIKIEGGNDFIGSVVGKCIHMKHDGKFHFDEGIWGKDNDYDMFKVASWTEQ
jgi:Tfp pilus assembly protein PilX